jgi:hypothetical protein
LMGRRLAGTPHALVKVVSNSRNVMAGRPHISLLTVATGLQVEKHPLVLPVVADRGADHVEGVLYVVAGDVGVGYHAGVAAWARAQ